MSAEKNKKQYSEQNIKRMKVAIFCIVAAIIFYFGANFLKGINAFGHKVYYYAVFDDIGALHESTTVAVNGYPIGKVSKITMLSTHPVKICAEFLITEKIDIPVDSRFEVAQKDVLGGMIVNVIIGNSKTLAHSGDTLNCALAPGMFDGIDDMKAQLQSVLASVDTIGLSVKSAFLLNDAQNGAIMLKNTLINLEASTRHLNQILATNEGKVNDMVGKLDQLSTTLGNATPQINNIIQNLDNISDSIAQSNIRALITDAQQTVAHLNAVTAKLENGEGSVGQLMNNDSLYSNLNKTTESLNALLKDLKEHPGRYIHVSVFGGKKNKNE